MSDDDDSSASHMRTVIVDEDMHDTRADAFVARALALSVREARGLFEEGSVTRAGRRIAKGDRVRAGEVLEVAELKPWLLPRASDWLVVVHEGTDVIVVDKPAGVPSHPLARGEGGTVADAVAFAYPECRSASVDEREGGLVHRLDTFTSGLIAAARTREAWQALRAAFSDGRVGRGYLALVEREVTAPLVLDAPIAHDPADARRMVTVDDAGGTSPSARGEPKRALSRVTPVSSSSGASLVVVRAEGGRRHQVRVHLASAGLPLVGDELYGGSPSSSRGGHLLHAAMLELPQQRRLTSAPPADFMAAVRALSLEEDAVQRALQELRAP